MGSRALHPSRLGGGNCEEGRRGGGGRQPGSGGGGGGLLRGAAGTGRSRGRRRCLKLQPATTPPVAGRRSIYIKVHGIKEDDALLLREADSVPAKDRSAGTKPSKRSRQPQSPRLRVSAHHLEGRPRVPGLFRRQPASDELARPRQGTCLVFNEATASDLFAFSRCHAAFHIGGDANTPHFLRSWSTKLSLVNLLRCPRDASAGWQDRPIGRRPSAAGWQTDQPQPRGGASVSQFSRINLCLFSPRASRGVRGGAGRLGPARR